MTHPPMFLSNLTKWPGLNKKRIKVELESLALGMNLSLSSYNVLKLYLIFFHIGEHFNTATCPF